MPMKKRNRSFVSLLIAFSFVVLAVTGILAFVLPFSLQIVGLHALMGFVFIGIIALSFIANRDKERSHIWAPLFSIAAGFSAGTASYIYGGPMGPEGGVISQAIIITMSIFFVM